MTGREYVERIEQELVNQGISKKQFYEECGVASATFSQWRNNLFTPSLKKLHDIEEYLGISFSGKTPPVRNDESAELREILRDRTDLRALLETAKDVPPSSVYALLSQLAKLKEEQK